MNTLIALLFFIQSGVIVALLVFFYRSQKQWMKYSLSQNVHEFDQPKQVKDKPEEPQDLPLEDISEEQFTKIISSQLEE